MISGSGGGGRGSEPDFFVRGLCAGASGGPSTKQRLLQSDLVSADILIIIVIIIVLVRQTNGRRGRLAGR